MTIQQGERPEHPVFWAYLILTAICCGALVMVIEVLGSRVVGPFFGVSLFVWTSIIAVSLLSLAVGYWIGGYLADHKDDPDILYFLILAAGLLTMVIPMIQVPVLKACLPLGLRWGALTSTTILFGPSLLLLGCVSPYLVKIATREFHHIGKTVGRFYALSTLGSVAGTMLAGFVLIVYMGIDKIFMLISILLVAIAAAYFLFFKRRWWPVLLLILPWVLISPKEVKTSQTADGTKITTVHERENHYGHIEVLDYTHGDRHIRELTIDGLIQGGIDMNTGQSFYEYSYFMQLVPRYLYPGGDSALMVGVGAGLVPAWYERQGVHTDVVDIDASVVEVAKEYFDYEPQGGVYIQDARYYLTATDKQYDYMLLDVFNGDLTPSYLISLEAFELMKQRMRPQGIFAMNFIADLSGEAYMARSVLHTIEQVFDNVVIYPNHPFEEDSRQGNFLIVAYDGEPRPGQDQIQFDEGELHYSMRGGFMSAMHTPIEISGKTEALVLTDNFNPIDYYDAPFREQVRANILSYTDLDLLLN